MRSIRFAVVPAALLLALGIAAAQAQEAVSLKVGHAQALKLDGTPVTVAVGDSAVASASVALDDTLMLIGRRPGTTNVVALAADGTEMANTLVRVERPDGRRTVSIIRAGQPQAYVCGAEPGCLAVDQGSQVIDYGETSDPARVAPDEAGDGELQTSQIADPPQRN
ncbi:MAG TPA: pilus assembly protein N-terminal domain-containing protein [Afifellaceae bacterium]|nr:pilus assembly protein N-terminal domain-containing protein [Afifellaceae bacterium]